MILRPETAARGTNGVQPAWTVVEATQHARGRAALITQPDHAKLAGEIAAAFDRTRFPLLDDALTLAIAAHDAGWATADAAMLAGGEPHSFLDAAVPEFIAAWSASIDAAECIEPGGGIIVSSHFARLAGARLDSGSDTGEDSAALERFLTEEATRRERLHDLQTRSVADLEALTDILQFCDLLSLYLCCGSEQPVEFPQTLAGAQVRAEWRSGACALTPTPLAQSVALPVSVYRAATEDRLVLTLI